MRKLLQETIYSYLIHRVIGKVMEVAIFCGKYQEVSPHLRGGINFRLEFSLPFAAKCF